MRIYYGDLEHCQDYIEDENHKVVAWEKGPISHKITNNTQFVLKLRITSWGVSYETLKPQESITIYGDKCSFHRIKVIAQDKEKIECTFLMEMGHMLGRYYCETKRDYYIVPIFKSGNIEIVTCKNCGVDLGVVPKYTIIPVKSPKNILKVGNFTKYNLIISMHGQVIQRIESAQISEVGVPSLTNLYIDTETEEVLWQRIWDDSGKKCISRVNGCCVQIANGHFFRSKNIFGPTFTGPFLKFLYASNYSYNRRDENVDINILCYDGSEEFID